MPAAHFNAGCSASCARASDLGATQTLIAVSTISCRIAGSANALLTTFKPCATPKKNRASDRASWFGSSEPSACDCGQPSRVLATPEFKRSEEHTSELQSLRPLV